jgi:paraquat-inducible protein B
MSDAKPAIVGAFVLSGMLLAIGAVLLIGGTELFKHTQRTVVYFPGSVAGLDVGAPVTFRGVKIGTVTSIAVHINMRDLSVRIPVYLELNPAQISLGEHSVAQTADDFDRLLKAGLRAQLNMESLITGELRVDLDLMPGIKSLQEASTPELRVIPSSPSKLQTLEDEIAALPLQQIAETARQTLLAIKQVADNIAPKIGPLADTATATAQAAHMTLDDIDRLALAGKTQLHVSGLQLARVLASSDAAIKQAQALVISLEAVAPANSRTRADLQASIRDLAASASALRGFSQEIERNPSALLLGGTKR